MADNFAKKLLIFWRCGQCHMLEVNSWRDPIFKIRFCFRLRRWPDPSHVPSLIGSRFPFTSNVISIRQDKQLVLRIRFLIKI